MLQRAGLGWGHALGSEISSVAPAHVWEAGPPGKDTVSSKEIGIRAHQNVRLG